MCPLNVDTYPEKIAEAIRGHTMSDLGPGKPNEPMRPHLKSLTVESAFDPEDVVDLDMGRACLSGLWLYHNFLEESHKISQSIATSTGSYWHGIMHRREPDYSNAGYWFRKVGKHPVFDALCGEAATIAQQYGTDKDTHFLVQQETWDPFAFIQLVEKCCRKGNKAEDLCKEIQQKEWELLFDFCYQQAIGY